MLPASIEPASFFAVPWNGRERGLERERGEAAEEKGNRRRARRSGHVSGDGVFVLVPFRLSQ